MFNFFRNKRDKAEPVMLKVDFHSHFLPGLDDGCKTLDESMELIEHMVSLGYTHLVMSPHVMGDFYKNTTEGILEKLELVRTEASQRNIQVQLEATAEYYLDEWFEEKVRTRNLLPFCGNHILFEISYVNEPRNLFETIFQLQVAGYRPVLAHPERYPYFHDRPEMYEQLVSHDCALQLNLLSLDGYYGQNEKKIAKELIGKKLVSFLGSDAHKLKHVEMLPKVFSGELFQQASQIVANNSLFPQG